MELTGISVPSHGILFWSLDLDDQTISLTVDSFPYDTIYAGYLTLVISGLDAMPTTIAVISTVVNDFEFMNSQLSISGDTLTLGIFPGIDNFQPGTSYTTTIILAVPEASSVVMMLLAGGVAGGLTCRRRRRARA
ncbi:MAG: PEP-CTERM sorting domain-containing protein [Planctomycetota bacterium]